MILTINHSTQYNFSEKVFLEPHYLRFTPSSRPYYNLLDLDIRIHPEPSGLAERSGLEGNIYQQVWFNELIEELKFEVKIEVETFGYNPFDFFVDIPSNGSGNYYKNHELVGLGPYLKSIKLSSDIQMWSNKMKESTGDNLVSYISFLNQSIHSEFEHSIREESNIMTPQELFETKIGSCRDLSWLMIQVLRSIGLAARFVSGYSYNPELGSGHELHAWVEVYLPGGGWIGLDPSAGIFSTETYIPVCASYDPEMTKPVIGSYRGNAKSKLKTTVHIELQE